MLSVNSTHKCWSLKSVLQVESILVLVQIIINYFGCGSMSRNLTVICHFFVRSSATCLRGIAFYIKKESLTALFNHVIDGVRKFISLELNLASDLGQAELWIWAK